MFLALFHFQTVQNIRNTQNITQNNFDTLRMYRMNVLHCLLPTTHQAVFSLIERGCSTQTAKHVHSVLTSLVAPSLGYEISAPQDTLDIKKTESFFLQEFFFLGWGVISSQHSLPP